MPAKRVGGQIRIPRRLFEEWIGTPITTWPPVVDSGLDGITTTVIAVNDTPKAFTSTKRSRRTPTPQTSQLFSV
jgi:hypothetical protein